MQNFPRVMRSAQPFLLRRVGSNPWLEFIFSIRTHFGRGDQDTAQSTWPGDRRCVDSQYAWLQQQRSAMQAVGYLRTSSPGNVGEARDSESRQRKAIQDYALKHGYEVPDCAAI